MKTKTTAIRAGTTASLLGVLATIMWSHIQQALGGLVTPEVEIIATWVSLIGFLGAMGYANLGVIPFNSVVRLVGYAFGVIGLMLTLLADENPGNVFLEVFLLYMTIRSLFLGKSLESVRTSWKKFGIASVKLAFFVLLGLLAAIFWPVSSGTEFEGAYWYWIALSGGVLISAAIFLLENGCFSTTQKFAGFYAVGNVILAVSYLGEYNFVGIALNVALGLLLLYVSFIETAFARK